MSEEVQQFGEWFYLNGMAWTEGEPRFTHKARVSNERLELCHARVFIGDKSEEVWIPASGGEEAASVCRLAALRAKL